MIWLGGFFRCADIGSGDGSLRPADRLRGAEIVVRWKRYGYIGPPSGPPTGPIDQGARMRRAVFLDRPKIRIVDRVNSRGAIIAPTIQAISLLPIAVSTGFER